MSCGQLDTSLASEGLRGVMSPDPVASDPVASCSATRTISRCTRWIWPSRQPLMTEWGASELWTRTTGTATIDFRNVTVEDEEFDHGHGFIADDDRGAPGDPGRRYRSLADRRGTEGTTDDKKESLPQSYHDPSGEIP